jgi:hypothetical protein
MNRLLNPVVAVLIALSAAVCFTAAAEIQAMDNSAAATADELSFANALAAGNRAWSAMDFWIQ